VVAPPEAPKPARVPKVRPNPEPGYSKAFDNFVGEHDSDIEGLLAYALYKRTVRDQCRQGVAVDGRLRDPPKSEVDTYKSSANNLIEQLVIDYEQTIRAELQQSYYEDRLEQVKGEIKAMIRSRTSFAGQIVINLIGWVITLAITLLVFFALRAGSVDQMVTDRVDAVLREEAQSSPSGVTRPVS
jgi:hypothetical protein